ncbi:MAG: phage portal protein [Candidatus Nanohaloarchaea archaeon]|nr:phage portal protein [Candidatus Nanohaloarchaea archaeon]
MPFASLSKRQATIDSVGGARPGVPEGKKSSHFFQQVGQGEPRHADLFAIRLLGQSPYMEWAKDIIKQQVTSTPLRIVPDVPEDEEPSEEHIDAAESATAFFQGNFNDDAESLDHFLNVVLNDVLDFNSGVVELVPDDDGFLDQMVTRDGLTFTKNLKESGLLAEDPAYLQFELSRGFTRHVGTTTGGVQGIDLREAVRDAHVFPFRVFSRETIEYSRDQIVWFQMDGRSSNPYGRGRVQKVRQLAEILLNGDIHRERYFLDDQYQKAIVQLAEASQNEIESLKEQLRNDKGNPHDLNVVGGREASVLQIDPEPEKMQFLESHKWYTKLALVVMGLNEAEGGIHENANLSVSEEMKRNAWRRTTKPLLEMLERVITRQILPFMREYHAVDGELKARFEPQNRFEKTQQQAIEDKELELQAMTPNEVREERGKEGYGPIGDLPMAAYQQVIQHVPGWSAEQISDEIEDVPDPSGPGGDTLLSLFDDDDAADGSEERDFECPFPFDSVEDCVLEMKGEDDIDNPHAFCNAWQNACDKVNSYADGYRDALADGRRETVLEGTREALRNDRSGEFPPLKSHAEDLGRAVADLFEDGVDDVVRDAVDEFPDEDQDTSLVVDAADLAERFDVAERLEAELRASNLEAMEKAADHHAAKLEADLEDRLVLPEGTRIDIDFDLMDTFTAERIKEKAAQAATAVNDTVRRQIREVILDGAENGWSSQRIADELEERVGGEFRDEHAEVVARTETLSASRDGSQALAESTDLVDGKEWIATDDDRTRPWHAAMDGVVEEVNAAFTVPGGWKGAPHYQPRDYPRTVRTVGEDQPFNCRCAQAPVPAEDMPDTVRAALDHDAVTVDTELTEKQLEVFAEHSRDAGQSFAEFWRTVTENWTNQEIVDEKGMVGSKSTIYDWTDTFLE